MKTIRIYQINDELENARYFMFSGLKMLEHLGLRDKLSIDLYNMVWMGDVEDDVTLDDIYRQFNINHPEDFRGHSLSTSDIVFMDDKYFYCDDYGWEEVTDLFPKPTLKEGEGYECVRDFVMEDGSVAYKAGKTYRVLNDYGHLGLDEAGSNLHKMSNERDFYCYFRKVKTKKKYIVKAYGSCYYKSKYDTHEEALAEANKLNEDYYQHKIWNVEEVVDEDAVAEVVKMEETPETKVMTRYNELKGKYPNTMILFRCGDFYEAYNDDAADCGKILGITVRKYHETETNDIKVAGFPYHALDIYLPKLVRAGQRIIIDDAE